MSLPYIVLGLSLLFVFSSPLGKAIKAAGFPVIFSSNGVIIAQLVVNLPFAVKLVSTAFRGSDIRSENAETFKDGSQRKSAGDCRPI